MAGEDLMFLLLCGIDFVFLLALGLAMVCTDLGCGMFFYRKDGGIYSCKTDRRLTDDTPANRRRISRGIGLFFVALDCLGFGFLFVMRLF
ncbi:hypothetical protein [uncultured Dysosmobacter sp.]|uniref:hypothetical protein n=1 Tax=uncultured Dysosmobacter sp. TaxID=2591384 RepID=UPI00260EC9A4|nr:hypothetical protein [uncultured Dysosmobacter sp.]